MLSHAQERFIRILAFSLLLLVLLQWSRSARAEEWKGETPGYAFQASVAQGLGFFDGKVGYALLPGFSNLILSPGFAPDINNEVALEGQVGPLFLSGGTAILYSVHLRWDFHYDSQTTFFALGGLGGAVTGSNLGNHFRVNPDLGLGVNYWFQDPFALRAEVAHNRILAGISFRF